MTDIYLVAWTGGDSPPQYEAFTDSVAAWATARRWAKDIFTDDTIDILRLSQPDPASPHIEIECVGSGDYKEGFNE